MASRPPQLLGCCRFAVQNTNSAARRQDSERRVKQLVHGFPSESGHVSVLLAINGHLAKGLIYDDSSNGSTESLECVYGTVPAEVPENTRLYTRAKSYTMLVFCWRSSACFAIVNDRNNTPACLSASDNRGIVAQIIYQIKRRSLIAYNTCFMALSSGVYVFEMSRLHDAITRLSCQSLRWIGHAKRCSFT